jgi:hypothetical protein
MKKTVTQLLFIGALLLLAFRGGAQIVNGTMDVNTPGGPTCSSVYGWTTSNDIQWEYQWNVGGTGWWADLTGCGWGNGHWMEQTVPTTPGDLYILSFQLGCWNGQCFTDAGADLYIDGGYVSHYAHTDFSGSQLAWATFDYCFVATNTTTTIRFVGNGAGTSLTPGWANPISNFVGVIGLDNVSLTNLNDEIVAPSICAPAVLTAPGLGNADWYFGGSYLGSSNTITATVPGTYTMIYNTPCGQIVDDIEIIQCEPCAVDLDFEIFDQNGEAVQTLCVGQPYTFSGYSNMGTNVQYRWDFGDGTPLTPPSSNPNQAHVYSAPGTYSVCLFVTVLPGPDVPPGCVGTHQICKLVNVVNCGETDPCAALVDFSILNQHGKPMEVYCAGQPFIFRGFSTVGAPLAQYTWDFGDGTTGGPTTNPDFPHTYAQPGTYVVCLTVRILPGKGVPKECEGKIVRICKTIVVKNCKSQPSAIQGNTTPTMQMEYPALDVFPNPVAELVTIGGLMEIDAETHLMLYTITGELVREETVAAGKRETTLSLKTLKAGVYILKIEGGEYSREIKLVKQ